MGRFGNSETVPAGNCPQDRMILGHKRFWQRFHCPKWLGECLERPDKRLILDKYSLEPIPIIQKYRQKDINDFTEYHHIYKYGGIR
jgi:hypothetical protein